MNCNCPQPNNQAKLLTVKKAGPNLGKEFYACAKPQGEQCGYFSWADTTGTGPGPQVVPQKSQGVQEILAAIDALYTRIEDLERNVISQCAPK